MKQFLIAFLLFAASLSAQAQFGVSSTIRIYRVSDQIKTTDPAGNNPDSYPYTDVSLRTDNALIKITIKGVGTQYYTPAQLLTDQGQPYGSTVNSAMNTYLSSIPATTTGGPSGTGTFSGNANEIISGTVEDDRLSTNITKQGNSFNGANQLLKLDANGKLPAADGSALTNLTGNLNQFTNGPGFQTASQVTNAINAGAFASLNSPTFTGTPTAPTAVSTANSTQIATTAFVKLVLPVVPGWLPSSDPGYQTATQVNNLINAGGFATLASPSFSGVPTAPTASTTTNSTQIATTAFVKQIIAGLTAGNGDVTLNGVQTITNKTFVAPLISGVADSDSSNKPATTGFTKRLFDNLFYQFPFDPNRYTFDAQGRFTKKSRGITAGTYGSVTKSLVMQVDTSGDALTVSQVDIAFPTVNQTVTPGSTSAVSGGAVKTYVDGALANFTPPASTTITNNLTTTATGTALDAAQGKILSDLLKATKRLARSASAPTLGTGRFSTPTQPNYAGTETDLTYGYNFTPNVISTGLRFSWPNWTLWPVSAPLEAAGPNPITIEASVSNGTATQQITWNGSTTVTIQPGATVVNDALPLPIFPTATANLRVHVIKGSSDKVVVGTQTNQFSTTDAVPSGTMTTTVVSGYAPLELMVRPLATPAKESVALIFDSQGVGVEGSEMGWIRAGLDAQGIPWARYAVGQSVIETYANNNTAFVLTQVAKYKTIITDIGNNNVFGWSTVAQGQAALTAWWTKVAASGADLYVCTISPSTQANSTQITQRGQLNDWIRLQATAPTLFRADGVTPLVTGVYDVGGITETPQYSNSCVPCSGCTSDGTHLNATGRDVAKALITSTSHLKEN